MADWQKIARFVAARGIKVAGNLLKGLCYLFHAICPEKRFTIPSHAKPLIRHKRERVIPRVVWQTNFTRRVTLPIYLNYLFNRMMAPTFEFRLLDDVEIRRWVLSLYPGRTFDSFSKLQIGAAQADLWRLLILHAYGGVYLDIDAHFVWPLEWTIASRADELFLKHKLGLTNYFIASRSNTDSIRFALNAILHNIEYPTCNDVSEITGPAALDRALRGRDVSSVSYRVTCYQGTFTNEFFQYLDHRAMKWSREQRHTAVVAGKGTPSFYPIFSNGKPPLSCPNQPPWMRRIMAERDWRFRPWARFSLCVGVLLILLFVTVESLAQGTRGRNRDTASQPKTAENKKKAVLTVSSPLATHNNSTTKSISYR